MHTEQQTNLIDLGMTYKLYIGQCNVRKMCDRQAIYQWCENNFDGCTYTDCKGMYKGSFEDSIIVTVATDKPVDYIIELTSNLRDLLNQESIGLEYNNHFYLVA